MRRISEYIGSQFGNPRGIIGKCCCLIMNIINYAMYKSVLVNINPRKHSKVLDIGYGNGYLISRIFKKFGCYMLGIDISADMQSQAMKKNQKAQQAGKIKLLVGDCCQLPFKSEYFDAVTSVNTIYFWNDTQKGLSEIYRTLKPQGVFCNVVYSEKWLKKLSYTKKGFLFFNKKDMYALGEKSGFSEIIIKDIVKGKSFLVIYKKEFIYK